MEGEHKELVELLRQESESALRQHLSMGMHQLCTRAADAIERLTADLERTRTELDSERSFIKAESGYYFKPAYAGEK